MPPLYGPKIAPSDYYLFRSLKNSLNGVKLVLKEAWENHLVQFFTQKRQKFYNDDIMVLPKIWQKIIDQIFGLKKAYKKMCLNFDGKSHELSP